MCSWLTFVTVSEQPFRAEINRIIAHYLAPDAPRELQLSPRTRAAMLHALQHTTNPSAFAPGVALIRTALEGQAHPNFIRWSICNGNRPRIVYVHTMGVVSLVLGTLIALLLTLSHVDRWWRLFGAPGWFVGIATLVASYKGLCVILHSSHSRNLKPWEDPAALYSTFTGKDAHDDEADVYGARDSARSSSGRGSGSSDAAATALPELKPSEHAMAAGNPASPSARRSLDTFGAANADYAAGDPCVAAYARRGLRRKVFEKGVAVQDATVRVLQDRITRQGQIWGLIVTIPLCVLFVAVPAGNFY